MSAPAALGDDQGICFRGEPGESAPGKWELQAASRKLLPREKGLQKCSCTRVRGGDSVEVWKGARSTFFSGLLQCGSVWICPVCAPKVAAHRAEEVQRGINYWLHVGGGALMVTLTFRHTRFDQLADLMERFPRALRRLKSGRAYQQLQRDFVIAGEIRALEVTHGDNGWHPHTHALGFTHRPLSAVERQHFEVRLYLLWRAACAKEGIGDPTFERGVHVRPAKDAADYIAKWGFAQELTRAHMKQAKGKGRTPWQLLAAYTRGEKRAAWLFREFAQHFKGRRQLYYSPGLRQRLGLNEELTEQEILKLPEPEPKELVCAIQPDQWRLVVRYKQHAAVLAAAEEGAAAVNALLERLRQRVLREVGTDGTFNRLRWFDQIENAMVRI